MHRVPLVFACFVLWVLAAASVCSSSTARAAEPPNYEQQVKPLLRDHCLKCHNADEANADLDLSSYAALLRGGSSGPVVHAGRPETSQLYRAIAHLEGAAAMPPERPKLPEASLALIRDWIRGGLVAGEGEKSRLRTVEQAFERPKTSGRLPRIVPERWPVVPLAATVRPPAPQAMAVSPAAPLVAVSGQQQVLVYSLEKIPAITALRPRRAESPWVLAFPEGTIHDLRFSANGALLLAAGGRGGHSGRVVLFDVKSGRRVAEIGDEVDAVLSTDISSDLRFVALGGPSRTVRIFDAKTGEALHRLARHTDWITATAFSPDGKLLATGDRSGGIHVWESGSGAIVYTLDEHKVRVTSLDWRSDGKLLASAADDGAVILWDAKDGWPVRNVAAHAGRSPTRYTRHTGALAVRFGSDGGLVSAGRDRTLRIWNGEGEAVDQRQVDDLPLAAAFLPGSREVVATLVNGEIVRWRPDATPEK